MEGEMELIFSRSFVYFHHSTQAQKSGHVHVTHVEWDTRILLKSDREMVHLFCEHELLAKACSGSQTDKATENIMAVTCLINIDILKNSGYVINIL